MNNDNEKKSVRKVFTRQLIITVVTVFVLAIVIMGSSYALFMDVDTSAQDNVYTSGDLVVVFNDKSGESANTINNPSLIPMSNESALRQTNNIYTFTITNTGTLPMKYDVLLNDVKEYADSNLLSHEYIKYQLCINNTTNCTIIRKLSTVEDNIIYQSNLQAGGQTIYYLRVWVSDENIPNDAQDKEVHLEVNVNGISANESYLAYYLTDNAKVKQNDVNIWYADENNYIKFNGENWRIIGVYNKLSNGKNIGSRIKIVKDEPLEQEMIFDSNSNTDYLTSEIRNYLNTEYLNSLKDEYKKLAEPVMINESETNVFLINKTDYENSKWLKSDYSLYTMTADENGILVLNQDKLETSSTTLNKKIKPVIFLSEMTEYVSGTGSKEDPYIILK